jgi:CarboxypepD_reg-like domain/TonB-dependent Receptor Plug Domain
MKHSLLLSLWLALAVCGSAFAQGRVVSGKVTAAEDPNGLPGVNVRVKNTQTGTTTDADGNFKVSLSTNDAVLVFSFIGYQTKEITVGAQSVINVTLQVDVKTLKEVVVTSLGIEREKDGLGYAVQSVKGEDLTLAREVNVINALQGRVPGMQLSQSASGPGGSTRIVLRGANSLAGTDNNAPDRDRRGADGQQQQPHPRPFWRDRLRHWRLAHQSR